MTKKVLDLKINELSERDILEKIKKYTQYPRGSFHIVSLNPENMAISQKLRLFKQIINKAQIRINDGVGTVVASQILGLGSVPRLSGVDLMEKLLNVALERRLRVVLMGGKGNLAEYLADCYNQLQGEANFVGLSGFKNIQKPTNEESKKVRSIVLGNRPHFLFLAFGSPFQELWIYKNRALLQGIVCMGVGGGFDFLGRGVTRAPRLIRTLGLEWLFRLFVQPWRIKRQMTRLPYFIWLVVKERFRN